jgi:hypothetical protein
MSVISLAIPRHVAQVRENSSNGRFGIGATVILTILAILAIASGISPVVDPTVFPTP